MFTDANVAYVDEGLVRTVHCSLLNNSPCRGAAVMSAVI